MTVLSGITDADWAVLDCVPTGDAGEVRRAYRQRLKTVGPEGDADAFQTLRETYERVLAACEGTPAAAPGPEVSPNVADRFIAGLAARRCAGDEDAAIAYADSALADHSPGSRAFEAIEDALLDNVALSRNVSRGLLLHLARRLDWRDAQGRAAMRDPERHALLLDRLLAEDWQDTLDAGESGRVGRMMRAPRWAAAADLAAAPITADERGEVRQLFDQWQEHQTFLTGRFDGGTLALLREAVEGPPLLGETSFGASASAVVPAAARRYPETVAEALLRQSQALDPAMRRKLLIICGVILAFIFAVAVVHSINLPRATTGTDTALPADEALRQLKDPKVAWMSTTREPGGVKLSWDPIMKLRRGVGELRIGFMTPEPTGVWVLPETDVPLSAISSAESPIRYVTMRVRYKDGQWSEIRRYDVPKVNP